MRKLRTARNMVGALAIVSALASYTAASAAAIRYTDWTDPREGAFHVQVPAGWNVDGGLFRSGPLDIRPAVDAATPDGQVHCSLGTKGIIIFAEPTQMTYTIGFREGSVYSPGYGQQEIIYHYIPAEEFAKIYVERLLGSSMSDLSFTRVKSLPELSEASTADASREAVPGVDITGSAGDVFFTGTEHGKSYIGYCQAIVVRTRTEGIPGGQWVVRSLALVTAPRDRAVLAGSVIQHMQRTFAFSQSFLQQTSLNAGAVSHEIAESAHVTDDEWRDMDNIINGEVETVNPADGEHGTAHLGSSYYWTNGVNTVGTQTDTPPGPSYTPLKQVWHTRN